MASVNVRSLTSEKLLRYERLRREGNTSWNSIQWEHVELKSGTGDPDNETELNIRNTYPAYKELFEAQRLEAAQGEKNVAGYCDVILVADDGCVPVHRVFLMGKSEFLDQLIRDHLKISVPTRDNPIMITLMGVKMRCICIVVSLLYNGQTVYNQDEEEDVSTLMKTLQLNLARVRSTYKPSEVSEKEQVKLISGFPVQENQAENNPAADGDVIFIQSVNAATSTSGLSPHASLGPVPPSPPPTPGNSHVNSSIIRALPDMQRRNEINASSDVAEESGNIHGEHILEPEPHVESRPSSSRNPTISSPSGGQSKSHAQEWRRTREKSAEEGTNPRLDFTCTFCQKEHGSVEELTCHLEASLCGRDITGTYRLSDREKYCITCQGCFKGSTVQNFIDHVKVCSARPSRRKYPKRGNQNENCKGQPETKTSSSSNDVAPTTSSTSYADAAVGPTAADAAVGPTAADAAAAPTAADVANVAVTPTAADAAVGPTAADAAVGPTAADAAVGPTAADAAVGPTAADAAVGHPAADVAVAPTADHTGVAAAPNFEVDPAALPFANASIKIEADAILQPDICAIHGTTIVLEKLTDGMLCQMIDMMQRKKNVTINRPKIPCKPYVFQGAARKFVLNSGKKPAGPKKTKKKKCLEADNTTASAAGKKSNRPGPKSTKRKYNEDEPANHNEAEGAVPPKKASKEPKNTATVPATTTQSQSKMTFSGDNSTPVQTSASPNQGFYLPVTQIRRQTAIRSSLRLARPHVPAAVIPNSSAVFGFTAPRPAPTPTTITAALPASPPTPTTVAASLPTQIQVSPVVRSPPVEEPIVPIQPAFPTSGQPTSVDQQTHQFLQPQTNPVMSPTANVVYTHRAPAPQASFVIHAPNAVSALQTHTGPPLPPMTPMLSYNQQSFHPGINNVVNITPAQSVLQPQFLHSQQYGQFVATPQQQYVVLPVFYDSSTGAYILTL